MGEGPLRRVHSVMVSDGVQREALECGHTLEREPLPFADLPKRRRCPECVRERGAPAAPRDDPPW